MLGADLKRNKMQINKNSWHYKVWASTFDTYNPAPESTDLCRYCHRIFWRLALYMTLIAMTIFSVGMLAYGIFYKGLYQNTMATLILTAIIGVVVGSLYLYNRWLNGNKYATEPKTLIGKYAHASKQKVCPLVQFKE